MHVNLRARVRSFVWLALFVVLASSSACKQRCLKAANCIRTCDCLNDETDQRLSCPVAFRCEGETGTCEDAYDQDSCEKICADYAATARCGVARCASDAECTKLLSCPNLDAQGNPNGQFRDCTFSFVCELDKAESCDPASTLPDAELCASCPPP